MDNRDMESLISRIPNGDLEALEGLYQDYHHAVYAYSLLLLHNQTQAEDHAQDVFLRIWEKASTYQIGGSPKAWIMSMTRNLAFDRLRRSTWETSIDDVAEDDLSTGNETGHQTEERIDLQNALSALAFQDRQIVLLKAVAGLPAKEISQLLGIPPSTVHWRYHRSLRLLADRLKGGLL